MIEQLFNKQINNGTNHPMVLINNPPGPVFLSYLFSKLQTAGHGLESFHYLGLYS